MIIIDPLKTRNFEKRDTRNGETSVMSSLRLTGRLSISGIDPSSISGSSALPQQRVLLIGSSGSGKTLLLRSFGRACEVCAARRLRRSSVASVMDLEPVALHTVPTTGVENARATFGTTQIFFQEVGAPMAQMWSTYYEKVSRACGGSCRALSFHRCLFFATAIPNYNTV